MKTDDDKEQWIQYQAFIMLQEITGESLYYIGTGIEQKKRLQKFLIAANSIHAIIIQSLQMGNEIKALRYLLLLKKVTNEIRYSKVSIEKAINLKFEKCHNMPSRIE